MFPGEGHGRMHDGVSCPWEQGRTVTPAYLRPTRGGRTIKLHREERYQTCFFLQGGALDVTVTFRAPRVPGMVKSKGQLGLGLGLGLGLVL